MCLFGIFEMPYRKSANAWVSQKQQEVNEMIHDFEHDDYYSVARRKEIREESRKLRKKFLRYKEAEIVYSIQHKKLLEMAEVAGALYRIE